MIQMTSIDAQSSIQNVKPTQKSRVLSFIAGRKEFGATDEEIQDALGMNPSTERPRRIELEKSNSIRATGTTRMTRSGRQAFVFRIA